MQQAAWASGARSELEAPLERNLIVHGLPPFVTESILYQALQQNPGVHSIRLLQASRGDSPTFTGVVRAPLRRLLGIFFSSLETSPLLSLLLPFLPPLCLAATLMNSH